MVLRLLTLKCPHCGKAGMGDGLFKTKAACPACGKAFEKEPGFFVGAIYPFYFLTGVTGIAVMLVGIFSLHLGATPAFALACVIALLASPYFFQFSRGLFVWAEARFFARMGN